MKIKKNKTAAVKISKGYRLKRSTHNRIKKLQKTLSVNQDTVISMALNLVDKQTKNMQKNADNI